jgi:hypothetical protein
MNKKPQYKLIVILLISFSLYKAQRKDSMFFSDYHLSSNLISRIVVVGDIGIERIKPIKNNFYYASQISLTSNLQGLGLMRQTLFKPVYYGFLLQPVHLLIGKDLKYEIGPAVSFIFYRYKGIQYPLDTVRVSNSYNLFHDMMTLSFTNGLRYTFKKSQISVKGLIGTRYIINLQRNEYTPYYLRINSIELGLNWRFRKKRYIKITP